MKTARSERNIYFISISVHSKCVRQSACVCVCVSGGDEQIHRCVHTGRREARPRELEAVPATAGQH